MAGSPANLQEGADAGPIFRIVRHDRLTAPASPGAFLYRSSTIGYSARIFGAPQLKRPQYRMHSSDYLREQAVKYRELAETTEDPFIKQEFLELAAVCEEVADRIDDRRASG
jgi:hypothetical protein